MAIFMVASCTGASGSIGGGPPDVGPDLGPDLFGSPIDAPAPTGDAPVVFGCNIVDILFVIDNSNSMGQEQANLIKNFPVFIKSVEAIRPVVKSYRVGVISTDIGAGNISVGTCKGFGDQGRLQHKARGAGCKASYPRFLDGPGSNVAKDFGCVAALGVGGCGFEQQLESALEALNNQAYNATFLRPNAPLAIIFISDEDDCSAKDRALFDPAVAANGPLNTRCVRLLPKLHPVQRYVAGFRALKSNPDRVVVGVISGPKGKVTLDSTFPGGSRPVCKSSAFGDAQPGNRFAELVKAFGTRGTHQSLCQGDLSSALQVIGGVIKRACLR